MRVVFTAGLWSVQILSVVLIARFAAAWFLPPTHRVSRALDRVFARPFEPLRRLLRRLPFRVSIDLSPILAVLVLQPVRLAFLWVLWKLP